MVRLSTEYMPKNGTIRIRNRLWNQLIIPGVNLTDRDYALSVEKVASFRPKVLWGFTSALAGLADYIKRNERYFLEFDPLATIQYNRGVITLIGDQMWGDVARHVSDFRYRGGFVGSAAGVPVHSAGGHTLHGATVENAAARDDGSGALLSRRGVCRTQHRLLVTDLGAPRSVRSLVLFGPFWWVFWIVHLGGAALSLLLLRRWQSLPVVGTGAFIVALTFVSTRLNILIPGQAVEQIHGLREAFTHPRLNHYYEATLNEYLVAIFVGGASVLLVAIGVKLIRQLFDSRKVNAS